MYQLFEQYNNAREYTKALLVGRNMLNRHPEDIESADKYICLLLSLAEKLPQIQERKDYLAQTNLAVSFLEESIELTNEMVDILVSYRAKMEKIAGDIEECYEKERLNQMKKIQKENEKQIKEIYLLKSKLENAGKKDIFNQKLQELAKADSLINHDFLTEEQLKHYNDLNKACTDVISSQMRKFEYLEKVQYNKDAVSAFDTAFKKFKADETRYKNQSQLFSLVSTTLFAFDAEKLFNETLIFYNHVYSYIFGKLDDDGKMALTHYSVQCERKLR